MVEVKSVDQIAEKWARVTPGRATDYEAGVRSPRKDWADEAASAEPAFAAGVQDAISRKAYSGGVKRAGTEKWQRKALGVGTGRYGPGVTAAEGDMKEGITPFIDEIRRTELPKRKAKGDPGNIERVKKIADALHKKKLAMQAGGR